MTWTSLAERFRTWQAAIRRTLEVTASDPGTTNSPEWYAGLAVSPASFSRQLGDMQASLVRANTVHPNKIRPNAAQFDSANVGHMAVKTQRTA
jgi:hypothetical protein